MPRMPRLLLLIAGQQGPFALLVLGALQIFGPAAAMLAAAIGAAARWLDDSEGSRSLGQRFLAAATLILATQVAALAYMSLGGTSAPSFWPGRVLPLGVAAVTLGLIEHGAAAAIAAFVLRQPRHTPWRLALLRSCASFLGGAGVAALLIELFKRSQWDLILVAVASMAVAFQAYMAHADRLHAALRRYAILDSIDEGVAVLAQDGAVTFWNGALERLTKCPRERAIGLSLLQAAPDVRHTRLAQIIQEAVAHRTPKTDARVSWATPDGPRVLDVTVLTEPGGVTLLWHDATDQANADLARKHAEERLALVSEGATDGLWEWDLRTHVLRVSGRWNAIMGLPAEASSSSADWWLDRVHPDDRVAVRERLDAYLSGEGESFLHEHRVRHEGGAYRVVICRGTALRDRSRRALRIAGSFTDITEHVTANDARPDAASRDPLTGLSNRAVFVEGLGRRLNDMKQRRGERFAVLYLDLDRFKVVNDSLGHLVGDELLTEVSRRFESCLREGDALARLGGDEFAILLHGLGDDGQANAIAFRIQAALNAPFSIGGKEVFTSASIGIAFSGTHYNNPEEIMRDADTAMYFAKTRGKACHELFDADMHARSLDRLGLETDLRHAVKAGALEMNYQPIVELTTGKCVGLESLVRWTRNGQAVSPATFIPIAEELGLIESLGAWVLEQACEAFADWQDRYPASGLEYITVNVSPRQLRQHNFAQIVETAMDDARLQPGDLRLEITETALMDSPGDVANLLQQLRDFGVKIYLDDFGTGYSSLSHLHRLPVDALKIDQSFVRSLLLPERPAIVESILALARTLGTGVVAEGVESPVQAAELARLGCRHAQGYLFSRPISPVAVEDLLAASKPLGQPQPAGDGLDPLLATPELAWPDDGRSSTARLRPH